MDKNRLKGSISFVPFLSWAIVIGILSLMPASDLPRWEVLQNYPVDKLFHLLFYGVLSFFASYGLYKHYSIRKMRFSIAMIAVIISGGYGILLEFAQEALPIGRAFEFWDIVANLCGAFLGTLPAKVFFLNK